MTRVAVRILHAEAGPASGRLERALAEVRAGLARRLAEAFRSAGATDVRVVGGPPDLTPFGQRLREVAGRERPGGLVVAGSGSLALARPNDLRPFLATAASGEPTALANNRFSADAVAVACAERLASLPDLPSDNSLARWLEEVAGYRVRDLAARRRLQVDVDGPLDVVLAGADWPVPADVAAVRSVLGHVRRVARDSRAELVVAGRTSARSLAWAERRVPARVRAFVEERGLRAAAAAARADGTGNRRPPRSLLGLLLDRDGPDALGPVLAGLGDAAVVDTRVLLAHRLGADESAWPAPEDRYASDLLLTDRVGDAWLRDLTSSAAAAPVPILLGGHTAIGPGLPLVLRGR